MEDCDNYGMVRHGDKPCRPLSTMQMHADVLRILKQHIVHQPFALKFLFITSNADNTNLGRIAPSRNEPY
jgi:hypothetical protein